MKIIHIIFFISLAVNADPSPLLDTVLNFPVASAHDFAKLSDGGYAGAYYVYENTLSQVQVRQYSKSGELIMDDRLKTKTNQFSNVLFTLDDGSFVVAGNLSGGSYQPCSGSFVARYKNRQLLWSNQYCNETTGYPIVIQRGCKKGSNNMVFMGPRSLEDSAQSVAFLETDLDGFIQKYTVTKLPDTRILEFRRETINVQWPDLIMTGNTLKSLQENFNTTIFRFNTDYSLALKLEVGLQSRNQLADYRIDGNGSITFLGTRTPDGLTSKPWLMKLDITKKILLDTTYEVPKLDTPVVFSTSTCVENDSLGLTTTYGSLRQIILFKVDRNGFMIYHQKFPRGTETTGALYPATQRPGVNLNFFDRSITTPGLYIFKDSGSGCHVTKLEEHPKPKHPKLESERLQRRKYGQPISLTGRILNLFHHNSEWEMR